MIMSSQVTSSQPTAAQTAINLHSDHPLVEIPSGHIGPVVLPGSGRLIWWTGRVAIGLRHEGGRRHETASQSALWVQNLMIGAGRPLLA
jgi:hypothetical protein